MHGYRYDVPICLCGDQWTVLEFAVWYMREGQDHPLPRAHLPRVQGKTCYIPRSLETFGTLGSLLEGIFYAGGVLDYRSACGEQAIVQRVMAKVEKARLRTISEAACYGFR